MRETDSAEIENTSEEVKLDEVYLRDNDIVTETEITNVQVQEDDTIQNENITNNSTNLQNLERESSQIGNTLLLSVCD